MSATSAEIEALLARFVEHHVREGAQLAVEDLCAGHPELAAPLRALIERYLHITASLDGENFATADAGPKRPGLQVPGFETIERIGSGGMGDVYKLRDLTLNRIVAAKVIRDRPGAPIDAFLREARNLALFRDRRIVQIHEVRTDVQPPVLIMEFVEGFELGRIGRSLEFAQRARIMVDVCGAIHHAHTIGLQHRDLKPSNIMLDAQLSPRILDFGLSASDPARGHFIGTPPYVAPEQLDRSRPIDARTDVYALGVVLYELLCGRLPEGAAPRLPREVDPSVPEPLQAIALTAMERDPALRYQSASDMAADLRRYVAGQPVLARPSAYGTTLAARVRPHLDEIAEWLRLRLIYPHEADRLRASYAALDAADDDWIVASRTLSYTQIALYLGAFLVVCGSVFYFIAARWYENVDGVFAPFVALALPFLGLNAAAHLLAKRNHKAVAVAFYLAAIALLPLFLLILFHETGVFDAPGDDGQLFPNNAVSNRQLQVTAALACAWGGWLALRTRTSALSTVFAVLALALTVAIVSDFGLRQAVEDGRWDQVAVRFFPLVLAYGALGYAAEQTSRPWFSRPAYLAGATLFVVVLELFALDGRALRALGGFSLSPWQSADVSSPTLLDTVAAMTVNGALFYVAGSLLVRRGTPQAKTAAPLLFAIAPFALLHPIGFLVRTGEYSPRFDWAYAAAALVIVLLSERRQRRTFYYAGLLNLGLALFYIASHREWFERPAWAVAVIVAGLAALAGGFALAHRRAPPPRDP